MRHYKKGRKLGTDKSHTKAMKKSLVASLLLNDRIKTIESRAKEIRPDVDKIITWAKRGDLHSRRLAIAALGDKEIVREIFEKVAQGMFADRNGGYTRIMKLGPRKGDGAPMVIMELVTEPVKKATAKPAAKKASPKRVSKKSAETKETTEAVEKAEEKTSDVAAEMDAWKEGEEVDQVEAIADEGYPVKEEVAEAAEELEAAADEAAVEAVEEAKAEAAEAEEAEKAPAAKKAASRAKAKAEEAAEEAAEKAEEAAAANAEAAEAQKAEKGEKHK